MTEQANFKRLLQSATGDDDASPQMLDVLYLRESYIYIYKKQFMSEEHDDAYIARSSNFGFQVNRKEK